MAIHATAKIGLNTLIDASADIGENVIIQDHVQIAPHAQIMANSVIGEMSVIGNGAFIGINSKIGKKNNLQRRSVIGNSVILGDENDIGIDVVVEDEVQIGHKNQIMVRAFLGNGSILGNQNQIHIGAVVGHIPQDLKFKNQKTGLKIGDGNVIREYATIHRSTSTETATIIGNNCFLMGGCHIAHDCHLGNNVIVANMAGMAGHVQIGDRAFLSGGAMIHQFVQIGRLAIVAGNGRFNMDVPPFAMAGEMNEVWGINTIGLRRAQIPSKTINELRELFRLFFASKAPRSETIEKIKQHGFSSPEVQEFISFVENSKRGICKGSLSSKAEGIIS